MATMAKMSKITDRMSRPYCYLMRRCNFQRLFSDMSLGVKLTREHMTWTNCNRTGRLSGLTSSANAMGIESSKRTGAGVTRQKEARDIMAHIRDSDFGS